MIRSIIALLAATLAATPATAKVSRAEPNGFEVGHSVTVPLSPDAAWRLLGQPARWWSPSHSYSGKAANLSLSLTPGGCFCEALPGGGVAHMQVAVAMPGKMLVLTGSLGPLLFEATSGVLRFDLKPVGGRTEVVMTYKASGFVAGNGSAMALLVDKVLTEQLDRYAATASRR